MVPFRYVVPCVLFSIYSNSFYLQSSYRYSKNSHLHQKSLDTTQEQYEDDYGFLELDKPVTQTAVLTSEYSIAPTDSSSSLPTVYYRQGRRTKEGTKQSSVDELEVDLKGADSWMVEACDAYEQRIGRPIWSKKTPARLKADYRRSQAQIAARIPDSARRIIEQVYIERTRRLSEIAKEDRLAVAEFRKWLREQKKNAKGSSGGAATPMRPLPGGQAAKAKQGKKSTLLRIKLEVSKRWLRRPASPEPGARPRVVLDELTSPKPGFTVGSNSKPVSLGNNTLLSAAPQGVITSSLLNWDKTPSDLRGVSSRLKKNEAEAQAPNVKQEGNGNKGRGAAVTVDDEEMFIANNVDPNEYYVLL